MDAETREYIDGLNKFTDSKIIEIYNGMTELANHVVRLRERISKLEQLALQNGVSPITHKESRFWTLTLNLKYTISFNAGCEQRLTDCILTSSLLPVISSDSIRITPLSATAWPV